MLTSEINDVDGVDGVYVLMACRNREECLSFSDRPRSIRFWPKRRRNGADPAVPDGAVEGDGGAGRRWDRARRSSSRFEGRAPSPRSVRRRQRALSPEMAPARTPVLGRIGLARTATVLASGSAQRPGTWGELRHTGP